MSVQASTWVIKNSRHKGSALLLMLMIANHAHADGTNAFPSVKTLAAECRLSERQIIRLIAELEQSGELIVERSMGGRTHNYSVAMGSHNPDKMSGTNDVQTLTNLTPNPDKSDISTLTNLTPNPDKSRITYKEESFKPSLEGRGEREAESSPTDFGERKNRPPADSQFHHPVIESFREVTKLSPPREAWPHLIAKLGETVDLVVLHAAFGEWKAKGYREKNFDGIADFYLERLKATKPQSQFPIDFSPLYHQ